MNTLNKVNWGIVGLGSISDQFVNDLLLVEDAEVAAVASRTQEKANAFAKKFNVAKAYDSYDKIFQDPEIDIIYIGTPHSLHAELTIRALEQGKHVLCEKPLALNSTQAKQMIAASKKNNKFLMEAFWSRFNPSIREIYQQIKQGVIGEVRYINADFAFYAEAPEGSRITNMELGGGALLDIGVYPLFLSYLILGLPEKIVASANFFESGADSQTSIILQYKNAQAVLHSSFMSHANIAATISGKEGYFNLTPVWHEAQAYTLIKNNKKDVRSLPTKGKGFTYEIEECHKCIRANKMESDLWSHQDSLNLISIADKVRKQIGLKYPLEQN